MTTYELPPEPPIGQSVRDAFGRTWKHEGLNRWELKNADCADEPETRSWRQLFLSALPPEPPIGQSVRDAFGRTWKHEGLNRWELKNADYADEPEARSWRKLFLSAPLDLIEPDPWHTEPLIVASIGERREVLARNEGGGYESPITSAWKGGPTLTDVVSVTVVPVAEWRRSREMLAAADAGDFDSFLGSFRALIAATDALGVDL